MVELVDEYSMVGFETLAVEVSQDFSRLAPIHHLYRCIALLVILA